MTFAHFTNWMQDDSGAVAVDWTVLAAAVVGLGIATVGAVRSGTGALATDIGNSLSSASVAALGELGAGDGVAAVADYVHDLLSVSQDTYDQWMAALAGYSDESLATNYAFCAQIAAAALEGANPAGAAIYIDAMAAYQQEMTARGLDIPEGPATVQDLDDRYREIA